MSKKIVVITGSPRKNGNSFAMTDAFVKAAEEKGHTITRFDAAMKKVGDCRACETCYSTGKACTFDDDFNTIAPAILEADAIVFTMPVYWYSIPAQIKGVIDRIFSLVVGGKDIAGKECALITCCDEDDMSVMDGVRIPVERMCALNKWKMVVEVFLCFAVFCVKLVNCSDSPFRHGGYPDCYIYYNTFVVYVHFLSGKSCKVL